jgi:hypothetical protein
MDKYITLQLFRRQSQINNDKKIMQTNQINNGSTAATKTFNQVSKKDIGKDIGKQDLKIDEETLLILLSI